MNISTKIPDLFDIIKTVIFEGKSYSISYGNEYDDKRIVKVNGEFTNVEIYSYDIKNMSNTYRDELKLAIRRFEAEQKNRQEYLLWDGKLD
jgi:hypothetical protein